MSTFLQLVNEVERESGLIQQAQRLATVLNAVGRQEKIVQNVVEAWRQIQNSRTDWPWMETEFEGTLTIGQQRYTAANLSLTDFSGWIEGDETYDSFSLYDNAIGRADETRLSNLPYRAWAQRWDRGAFDNQRPTEFSVDRTRRLCVGGPPDKAYKIRGAYRRGAQILAADADVPICPPEHHDVIVWRALMLLAGHDEAQFAVAHAQTNYISAYRDLVNGTLEAATT